tara:strand:- start:1401 stop:2522 length:1122 start_codon:yes stop_codon:yes gene_type:complete
VINKKNIIICVEKKVSQRDIIRFGVNILKKYFNVDIVNFSDLINGTNSKHSSKQKNINDIDIFLKLLKKKNYIFAIDYLRTSEIHKTYIIKKIIKDNKIQLVQIHNGLLPIAPSTIKNNFIKVLNLKILFSFIKKKIINLSNKKIQYDVSLISGLKAPIIYPETKLAKKKIYTHSFDYEQTLQKNKKILDRKYGVFIDENLILHPDYKIFKIDLSEYLIDYYKYLAKSLKVFKKEYKIDIIICAHPSLSLNIAKKYLSDFKYSYGNTKELVKNSDITFIHQSTAISFPVIYNKPIVFLNYSKIRNIFLYENINRLSSLFNKKVYLIDNKLLPIKQNDFKVDKSSYSKYLNNYIIHPKSNKNTSMWVELAKNFR